MPVSGPDVLPAGGGRPLRETLWEETKEGRGYDVPGQGAVLDRVQAGREEDKGPACRQRVLGREAKVGT